MRLCPKWGALYAASMMIVDEIYEFRARQGYPTSKGLIPGWNIWNS